MIKMAHIGKHLGLFKEKVEIDTVVPLGPQTIIMNMPDGSVIRKSQEAAEEVPKKLGPTACESIELIPQ